MAVDLTAVQVRRERRRAQLVDGSDLAPEAVVDRAVAMQGQDLPSVLRSIAVRSRPGTTVAEVRAAFDAGALVRSWPMRGTLFATTPAHLATLLPFTAGRTHRAAARRRAQLGLDDRTVARARSILLEELAAGPLTRAQVLARWTGRGVDTTDGRGYHLLLHLAVDGLVHWGPFDPSGSEQLLVLSGTTGCGGAEVGEAAADVALAEVVRGFVLARGPVTEADLAWWTKLPKTLLRRAAAVVEDLVEVSVAGAPAWVVGEPPGSLPPSGVTLLPAFDEWILGYADRSAVAGPTVLEAVVPGGNGVFRPVVLVDGVVVGTWRVIRATRRVPAHLEAELVEPVSPAMRRAIDRALESWPHR